MGESFFFIKDNEFFVILLFLLGMCVKCIMDGFINNFFVFLMIVKVF